jgi:hypothetical protein
MIRKLQSGEYRLYSRKINPKTGKRRNLGTFKSACSGGKTRAGRAVFQAALSLRQNAAGSLLPTVLCPAK